MTDLRELYQEVILDHSRSPRNEGTLEGTNNVADGHNPLCGDRLKVFLKIEDDRIAEIRYQGSGCAISMASASLMSEALTGVELGRAEQLFQDFHALVTGGLDPAEAPARLGKLAVFAGVREFPVRVKCASLAWHTLKAARNRRHEKVTTE